MHDLRAVAVVGVPALPCHLMLQRIVHIFQSSKVAWQSRFVENVAIDGTVHVHLMYSEPDAFSGTRRGKVRYAKASRADGLCRIAIGDNSLGEVNLSRW
jgi:hypothetical protein